jgi:hypothetical protein
MDAILEAEGVFASARDSRPFSMSAAPGEIVGLLFAPKVPRQPLLRVLAGQESPRRGKVRFRGSGRVALVGPGASRAEPLAGRPDLVILDGFPDTGDRESERDAWAWLASERERGAAVVLATDRVEQAYRSDRVALAEWLPEDLTAELLRISYSIQGLLDPLLGILEVGPRLGDRSGLRDLQRLTHAARDLLREARALVRGSSARVEVEEVGAALAGVSLDDRVIDSLIACAEGAGANANG